MLDDILDLFSRRKRRPDTTQSPSTSKRGLPFEMPFVDDDDERDERDGDRNENARRSTRRPSSNRSADEADLF